MNNQVAAQTITSLFSIALYYPSLGKPIKRVALSNVFGHLDRYKAFNPIFDLCSRFSNDDNTYVFGTGVTMIWNGFGIDFVETHSLLFLSMLQEGSWDDSSFGYLFFVGRSLDCQTILVTTVPANNEHREARLLSLCYGLCRYNDVSSTESNLVSGMRYFVRRHRRSLSFCVTPGSHEENWFYVITVPAVRNSDSNVLHSYVEGLGLSPNTVTFGVYAYTFTDRQSLDNVLLAYNHVLRDFSYIGRAPAGGGAVSEARWYKGGQYLPGHEENKHESSSS